MKKETNNQDNKDVKKNEVEEKKQENLEPEKQMFEFESPEDLQKFLEALKSSKKGKKRHVIGISNRIFQNPLVNFAFFLVLNTILTLAFTGYFGLINYDSLWRLFAFIGIFTLVELILKDFIFGKFPFLVFATMGIILFVISIGSMLLALVISGIDFENEGDFFIYFFSFSIIRMLSTQYFLQRKRKKLIIPRR